MKTTDHADALHLDNNEELAICGCGSTAVDKNTLRCTVCQIRHLANWPDAHVYYEILDELNIGGVEKAHYVLLESQLDAFEQRPGW